MSLSWTIERRPGGARVVLRGQIDEKSDLASLGEALAGEVELDLGAVARINSTGVRDWLHFVHHLPAVTSLTYASCSPAIVTQLNTIYNFRGRARVVSLLAPFVCEACEVEETRPIDLATLPADRLLPPLPCARCGGPMVFDELPERYFGFLKEG